MPCDIAHTSPPAHSHTRRTESLHSTHSARTTTIRQRRDLTLSSEIPHNGVSRTTGCSERVLNVVIPCECRYLIEFGTASTRRIRLAWIFEVPNIDLSPALGLFYIEARMEQLPRH